VNNVHSKRQRPSLEEVRERFVYDPDTGVIARRNPRGRRRINPPPAGKHQQVSIRRQAWSAHIIIWFMMTGQWPDKTVDHRDRDRTNNRWSNLRLATKFQQQGNRGVSRHSRSGVKGVSLRRNKWVASITMKGRCVRLGRFNSIDEAERAYKAAADKYFGEFACTDRRTKKP
jgi:hypothetical protein